MSSGDARTGEPERPMKAVSLPYVLLHTKDLAVTVRKGSTEKARYML